MVIKETILEQLSKTSNEISLEIDKLYSIEIEEIAEEMAFNYQLLENIINREDQTTISDEDFQAALLLWTALNTYLSAVELFRRGYVKEPPMLIRNILEIVCASYDLHCNPDKLKILRERPNDFDSKKSIKISKKINPIVAKMWGMLSSNYSHVSVMHTVPHQKGLCIGGLFNIRDQKNTICGLLPPLNLTIESLGSITELIFINQIKKPRFWIKQTNGDLIATMPDKNRIRGQRLQKMLENELNINKI